jgi:hypothetical protein
MEGQLEDMRPKIASLMQQWAGGAVEEQESLSVHLGDPTAPTVHDSEEVESSRREVQLQAPQGNATLLLDGSGPSSRSSGKVDFYRLGPRAE